MLSLQNVHKPFGGRVLYTGVSLRIEQGSRWGLVGPDGPPPREVGMPTRAGIRAANRPRSLAGLTRRRQGG